LTLSAAQKSTYEKINKKIAQKNDSGAHSLWFPEVGILVPFESGATRSREAQWRVPLV
jgi:hypothetical protein